MPFGFGSAAGSLFLNRSNALWVIDDPDSTPRLLHDFQASGGALGIHGGENRSAFGAATGSALLFDALEGPFPNFTTTPWVSFGTSESTVPVGSLLRGPEPSSVASNGRRVLSARSGETGSSSPARSRATAKLRRIRIERATRRLGVVDPTRASNGTYFIDGFNPASRSFSFDLWKIKGRR